MNSKEVAINFFGAADHGDFATVEKLFGPKHLMHSSMTPAPVDTMQHIGMMRAFRDGFSDTRHEILDLIESGTKVVVRGIWHGRHSGEFNGMPASGNNVRLPFIAILEVDNDEIVNQWMELDSNTMIMQMQIVPAAASAN